MSGRSVIAAALALGAVLSCVPVRAQQSGGGPIAAPMDHASQLIDRLQPQIDATARQLGLPKAPVEADGRTGPTLAFPLRARPPAIAGSPYGITNFLDIDSNSGIRDFACGQRTYDGHRGIDFSLSDFAWMRMDQGDVEVVAARDGVIVARDDGNSDRNCSMNSPDTPNYFAIRADDGNTIYYLHMKSGSLSAKAIGDRVSAGEYLGLVGSSGISTGPHLHFEIRRANGTAMEPFAGACAASDTLWKHQWHAQRDPRLVGVATSNAEPVFAGTCGPDISDNPHYADSFQPGDTIYGSTMLRDQPAGQRAQLSFVRPDGSIASTTQTGTGGTLYPQAAWWNTFTLPGNADSGVWTLRVAFGNDEMEHAFVVGSAPPATQIAAAILPGGRSVTPPNVASLFATIVNYGQATAYGCGIAPETPIDADFTFQTTNAQNELTGTANRTVTIPAGGAQTFFIGFTPHSDAGIAREWKTRLRFKCTNAPGALVYEDVNAALISMDTAGAPDIIPIGTTPSGDSVVRIAGAGGSNLFAAAAINIGMAGALTARPVITGGAAASVTICETTGSPSAACTGPMGPTAARSFATNDVATFTVFVTAASAIAFDPPMSGSGSTSSTQRAWCAARPAPCSSPSSRLFEA